MNPLWGPRIVKVTQSSRLRINDILRWLHLSLCIIKTLEVFRIIDISSKTNPKCGSNLPPKIANFTNLTLHYLRKLTKFTTFQDKFIFWPSVFFFLNFENIFFYIPMWKIDPFDCSSSPLLESWFEQRWINTSLGCLQTHFRLIDFEDKIKKNLSIFLC